MSALELRVLIGVQAGARMSVGDGRYVIGSAEPSDIILAGPWIEQQHAALEVSGSRATLVPMHGGLRGDDGVEITEEVELTPTRAIEFDGVWIMVAPPDAPWPDSSEIIARRVVATTAHVRPEPGTEQAPRTTPSAAAEKKAAPASVKAAEPFRALLVPVAVAVLLLLLSGAWLWMSGGQPPGGAGDAKADAKPAPNVVEQRLAGMSMGERVVASRTGSGWMLVGIVTDEAERERLRAAFADIQPAVAMRVHTEAEVATIVANLIARSGLPAKFEITGGGRAKLTLGAPSAEAAEQVAQGFRDELGTRDIETEFVTPASLVPPLQDLVDKAGLGSRVRLATAPGSPYIAAQGALANPEFERWTGVVQEFTRRHGEFVKVRSAITRISPAMPFKVRAVLDGPNPQVLTADGQRIFEGGSLHGYRLVAVRENELVFDGPEKVSIARPKVEASRAAPAR